MTEPPRLFQEDDALKRMILRSSELDVPSARSLKRAHALALGVASSTVAGVGAAASGGAATAGSLLGSAATLKVIAIWAGVGVLSGALVSGTAVTVLDHGAAERRDAPPATKAAEREQAPRQNVPAGGADPATEDGPKLANQPPQVANASPAHAPVSGRSSGSAGEPSVTSSVNAVPVVPVQSAARYAALLSEPERAASSDPSDELARELAMVDQARSALRSGNAAAALELVARYERTFKRQRFAPEASAIRIEALIAQGRRAEAARLARAFMARHPGHPLTPRLREFSNDAP